MHAQMAETRPFLFLLLHGPGNEAGDKFLQNFISSRGWTCKKYRNKAGMKIDKKTTLLWTYMYGGKKKTRRLPYICCIYSRCRIVFSSTLFCHRSIVGQSSCLLFSTIVWQQGGLAYFHPCHVSVLFTGPTLLEIKFSKTFSSFSYITCYNFKCQRLCPLIIEPPPPLWDL